MAKIRLRWGKVEETVFSNLQFISVWIHITGSGNHRHQVLYFTSILCNFRDQFVHPPWNFKDPDAREPNDCMRRTLCSSLDMGLFRTGRKVMSSFKKRTHCDENEAL